MPGRIETDILDVLQLQGSGTARELHATLERAYPVHLDTVRVTLWRMQRRGSVEVAGQEDAGQHRYRPTLAPPECTGDLVVHYILDRLIADYPEEVRAYLAQHTDLFGCICETVEKKPGSRFIYTCPVHGVQQK